ncbi:MAG TPA: hypothetical protein VG713_01345, partial [Pirellulales bacterium]|nr:hypothetical protein [Pirellulales bacterium]
PVCCRSLASREKASRACVTAGEQQASASGCVLSRGGDCDDDVVIENDDATNDRCTQASKSQALCSMTMW